MTAMHAAATPQIEHALAKSINFELTIADLARRSERRAWRVAAAAVAMSLILLGGYFYLLPLKQKVPYLVMADAYTGTSTVARLAGDFNDNTIAASEAVNRSNVAHFILAREAYDYNLIRLRDWTTVYTMASPQVAAAYSQLHAASNPDSPYNTYGRTRAIRVAILSIQLLGGDHAPPKGATVRFQRSVYDLVSAVSQPLDSRIATLEFTYKPDLAMGEKDRIENPLGFQVTSYRVDNDYAPSPPLRNESDPLPQPATSRPLPPIDATDAAVGLAAAAEVDATAPLVAAATSSAGVATQ